MVFLSKNSIIVFLLCFLLTACNHNAKNTISTEAFKKVSVQSISADNLIEQLDYSGTIQADNTVQSGFSVSGRINSIAVEEGQNVKSGQLLATIEKDEYQNAFVIANAAFEQAQDNYRRSSLLHDKGSLTDREYMTAKSLFTQAQGNKDIAEKHLHDANLYAPFNGVVVAKLIGLGASVLPGSPAFTLMKTDLLYAQAAVPESEINKLSIGADAAIVISSSHDTLHGKVTTINPQADAISKTFTIKIKLSNENGKLLPGIICDIKISTGKTVSAVTVPGASIIRDADGLTYVYVVDTDNKAILKRINVGRLLGNAVIVVSGLQQGDKVVISGQNYIKDGEHISII